MVRLNALGVAPAGVARQLRMPHHPHYRPDLIARARELRRNATFPERLLWARLRRGAAGVRFRRQHSIGRYIVDFYAPSVRLAVEVDGRSHLDRLRLDLERERAIAAAGVAMIRFTNDDVLENVDAVAESIAQTAHYRKGDLLKPQREPPPDAVVCNHPSDVDAAGLSG